MKTILFMMSIAVLLFGACTKDNDKILQIENSGNTTITFDAIFGNNDFSLNQDFISGTKTYNFTKFRYWISNVVFINIKGEEYKVPDAYYLIEETNAIPVQDGAFIYPARKREDIVLHNLPAGDYKSIRFAIGVDHKYNDNLSLQSGELSQLNGMTNISWMWMTSYIFSSVVGKVSESSGVPAKSISIETGLNANFKTLTLDLPQTLTLNTTKNSRIVLTADVEKVTAGIDVISNPVVGASKAEIMGAVAANYATKVFAVKSVK